MLKHSALEPKQDTCESGIGHLLSECPWVLPHCPKPLLPHLSKREFLRSHERTHAPKTKFSEAVIDPYYYLQLWPQLPPDLPNIRVLGSYLTSEAHVSSPALAGWARSSLRSLPALIGYEATSLLHFVFPAS